MYTMQIDVRISIWIFICYIITYILGYLTGKLVNQLQNDGKIKRQIIKFVPSNKKSCRQNTCNKNQK